MNEECSGPDNSLRRTRIYRADVAQTVEERRSLIEREGTGDSVVVVDAAVEVGELFDAGDKR